MLCVCVKMWNEYNEECATGLLYYFFFHTFKKTALTWIYSDGQCGRPVLLLKLLKMLIISPFNKNSSTW